MKVVERVLAKRRRRIVTVDDTQLGMMPDGGKLTLQGEYLANGECFVDLEEAFDRVLRKVLQ